MATITKIAPSAQPNAGTVHWLNQCVERGKTEVFSEVVTVSPGLAAELLRRNDGNRSVRQTKAEQYAIDMREGRWAFNGEPIIISVDGKLNDGQHRLQAVIDANICVVFLLVFGLSRESRETVDQGAARGASDYLGMGGLPNATTAAGIARLVLAYEQAEGQSAESKLITNASVVERVRAGPLPGAALVRPRDLAPLSPRDHLTGRDTKSASRAANPAIRLAVSATAPKAAPVAARCAGVSPVTPKPGRPAP